MTRSEMDEQTPQSRSAVRIAVVTNGNALDVRTWSGTPHNAFRAIQAQFQDVHLITHWFLDVALPTINKLPRAFGIDLMREPLIGRWAAWIIDRRLRRIRPDVVVSVGASHKLAAIKHDVPIIHVSDALFATIIKELNRFHRLKTRSIFYGNRVQQAMIDRSTLLLVTSNWAMHEAQKDYVIPRDRIKVVPLGANIVDPGKQVIELKKQELELLFIGTDWRSKGGEKLLKIFRLIKPQISTARLHIVGCQPQEILNEEGVELHGYLDKRKADERSQLEKLYRKSAMLCVLTEQEAFGLVFCEAAAYGLPVISRAVGGVPSIVRDGITGLLFDLAAEPDVISRAIVELWADRKRYEAMQIAARAEYELRLNWHAWAKSLQLEVDVILKENCRGATPHLEKNSDMASTRVLT